VAAAGDACKNDVMVVVAVVEWWGMVFAVAVDVAEAVLMKIVASHDD